MEYTWLEFTKLNHMRQLSLNEQAKQYQFYLDSLSIITNINGIG